MWCIVGVVVQEIYISWEHDVLGKAKPKSIVIQHRALKVPCGSESAAPKKKQKFVMEPPQRCYNRSSKYGTKLDHGFWA